MRVRRQSGFTMVELLVVISVIAMLVAILLPAVNMARESARNTQCKNNVKQLAMAANSYQTRMNAYPGYRSLIEGQPVSWVVKLAPDFGERNLAEQWRESIMSGTESVNMPVQLRPYLVLLTCPSDPRVREDGPSLSYMANAGRAEEAPEFNLPAFGVFLDQVPRDANSPIPSTTSAFLEDKGDGGGKTLLFAENVQLLLGNQTGTRWDTADNKMSNVFVWHCTSTPSTAMKINGALGSALLTSETARPASNHSGGANVAFCDNRVTLLRDDIDYRVYIRLMAPHDQGVVRIDSNCGEVLGPLLPLSSADYE